MKSVSYRQGPPTELLETTIGEALSVTASRFPDREALIASHQNVRLTWRQLDQEVTKTARGLAGLGLQRGDRLGVWASNCAEWTLLQLASARAGYILVNVNPAYRSHELRFVLKKSGMKAVFLRESDSRSNYKLILDEAMENESVPLEHSILLGTSDWTSMIENGRDWSADPISNTDPVNIQYTSGTTGSPKGVLLTHRGLLNNGWLTGRWLGMTENDRFCCPFPMYHCAGCVCAALNCVANGATLILPSAQFDALASLTAIQNEKATVLGGVPTMFIAQLDHPEFAKYDTRSLRIACMGGAPCPEQLLRRVQKEMHCETVAVIYGQTEASPVLTMSSPADTFEQRVATVGCTMPETEVKVVAPGTSEPLPAGEQGELCGRGYCIMLGYDGEPEATARAIDKDGWLHTGDLATMREDGYFCITGRLKDMIIRGGENIYPREIEEFLFRHPKVSDVQVVGIPDAKLGETVAAWVRVKTGETLTEDELREYCNGRIAHFKIPQYLRFVDEFPMTVTGKIQKFRIRELEIAERQLASSVTAVQYSDHTAGD